MLDRTGRVMTSDSRVTEGRLHKLACRGCGLVRNGDSVTAEALAEHYSAYELGEQAAAAEPLFFTKDGTRERSAVIAEWMISALARVSTASPPCVLEIGCGEGNLLARLRDQWPAARVAGLDLSPAAVELARGRGLDVSVGGYDAVGGPYDLILSFAVLEHVPSPADYFRRVAGHLTDAGALLVAQPSQDAGSSDIFYVDHLHHFASSHVAALAARSGLRELHREPRHELIPNFSLHLFGRGVATESPEPFAALRALRETVSEWERRFAEVDRWLEAVGDRRLVVWGLGQTFTLLRAYSTLGDRTPAAGLDDNPSRFAGRETFPVVPGTDCATLGEGDALLVTFRPGEEALARLAAQGVDYHVAA